MGRRQGLNPVVMPLALAVRIIGPTLLASFAVVVLVALIGPVVFPITLALGILLVVVGKVGKAAAIRRLVREELAARDRATHHLAGQQESTWAPHKPVGATPQVHGPRVPPTRSRNFPEAPAAPEGWYANGPGSAEQRSWDGSSRTAYLRPTPACEAVPPAE